MLDDLNRESFAQHLNTSFAVHYQASDGTDASVEMELVEAQEERHHAPDKGREAFSLMFAGPRTVPLEQGTYDFKHARLGSMALFIVPIGEDDKGRYYQCIFNRLARG